MRTRSTIGGWAQSLRCAAAAMPAGASRHNALVAEPTVDPSIAHAGWCARCAEHRVVRSGRGSTFVMCERGLRGEAGYVKYPPLPVLRCDGLRLPAMPQND